MYHLLTRCRACGFGKPVVAEGIKREDNDERLKSVLNLGVQPLANNFVKENEMHSGYAPLEVLYCPRCTLAQLSVVVDPEILYRNYAYVTSPSETMREHFQRLEHDLIDEGASMTLFEIGCNDGRLLRFFREHGWVVGGIDPAANLKAEGLPVITGFWGKDKVCLPANSWSDWTPSVILARHVFCHVDDWHKFIAALDDIANIDTLVCIEVPWAQDTIQMGAFDTIYHEHLSYFTLHAMQALLADTHWHMHKVLHYPVHGGALMVMLRHNQNGVWQQQRHVSVDEFLANETVCEYSWNDLDQKRRGLVIKLQELVKDLCWKRKRIVAYGASAKCTVLLNQCGFTRREIAFVTDTTPGKLYRNVPGTDIPVVDEGALTRELPDYALMTAWNYSAEIVAKEQVFKDKGGKWIVPMPELRML